MDTSNLQNNKPPVDFVKLIETTTIVEIKLLNKGNTLAAANVMVKSYAGYINISGFLIFRSSKENPILQDNINITPPSRKVGNKYYPQVFFGQKDRWAIIQKLIYKKYLADKEKE